MTAPDPLRGRIERDLRPTRPLLPPSTRALALTPIALATVVAVPVLHVLRSDVAQIGLWRAWGLSLFESMAGLVVVSLALRESIPGRALSRRAIALTFAGGLLAPAVVLLMSAANFSIGSGPGEAWSDNVYCFRTSASAAIPALVAVAFLAWRALPVRPVLTGALYGLGCGVMADAGLRMFCGFTEPSHVLTAHGGAIVAVMIAGALASRILSR